MKLSFLFPTHFKKFKNIIFNIIFLLLLITTVAVARFDADQDGDSKYDTAALDFSWDINGVVECDGAGNCQEGVTGDLDVAGKVWGYTSVTEATSERVLTNAEISGGIVRVSFAGEVRLPDVCDTATGAMVMIIQDDASEVIEIAVTDTDDYTFLNGVSLGQNQEIDSEGAAKTDDFIVMVCTVAGEWHSFGRAGTWVDGGAAD